MTNLQQEVYEDDNGIAVPVDKVDGLGTFNHVCDGFFRWTCGNCGEEHSNRMFRIAGVVVKCQPGCGRNILLVRTNCTAVTEALQKKWNDEGLALENARLKEVTKYNVAQIREVQRVVMNAISTAVSGLIIKAEAGK